MSKLCLGKHTKYQPPDTSWQCPRCGSDAVAFYIDWSDPNSDPDCNLLHSDDAVVCDNCSKAWSGSTMARILQRKASMIECPICHGTGFVKKEEG